MESYAARLASFNATHPATKKRASDPKGTKKLKWPHKNPSPSLLAQAGFYYQPSSSCPDNVTCYLCQSNIDQWEETDNPIDEHLAHAKTCGWATIVSVERAIEDGDSDLPDPLSDEMIEARRATFSFGWPHESKRGWLCKVRKLVDAGWHYCPTPESDDYVRCSYCSLGLDGWEPKDNPYKEHERRSPECMFFKSVGTVKPQNGKRSKKERTSKASRMSTQSNLSITTGAPSFVDGEPPIDDSSVLSSLPTSKANTKKGAKKTNKGKKSGSKKTVAERNVEEAVLASSYLEPEDDDFSVKIDPSPEPVAKGRKRQSHLISTADETTANGEEIADTKPPPSKRRVTRARSSVVPAQPTTEPVSQSKNQDTLMTDVDNGHASSEQATKKGRKGGKKRGTSAIRKASTISTASKASLRAEVPNNDEIDAALELDLENPVTDDDEDNDTAKSRQSKSRRLTRTKPSSREATASAAPTCKATRSSTLPQDESVIVVDPVKPPPATDFGEDPEDFAPPEAAEIDELPKKRTTGKGTSRKKTIKKAPVPQLEVATNNDVNEQPQNQEEVSEKSPVQEEQNSLQPSGRISVGDSMTSAKQDENSSMFGVRTLIDDSGHETDASVAPQGRGGKKKKTGPAKKGKKGKKVQPVTRKIEEIIQPPKPQTSNADDKDNQIALTDEEPENMNVEPEIPKPQRAPKEPKAAKAPAKNNKAKKVALKLQPVDKEPSPVPVEPVSSDAPPLLPDMTPAASPQSSDAENQPPSSRPSALRPPLGPLSTTKLQPTRVPLAASTPTRSPSKNTFSKLQSTVPWTAADLELIFQATPNGGNENALFGRDDAAGIDVLTSPEKKLTVEQWIQTKAQRGEDRLRTECERMVGRFEGEGMRALQALEGIVCAE